MKNLMMGQKKKTQRLMPKVLLFVLIVAVLVVATSAAQAASDDKSESLRNKPTRALPSKRAFFNPFTLQTESGNSLVTWMSAPRPVNIRGRQPIRIPQRPEVRSVFRPNI